MSLYNNKISFLFIPVIVLMFPILSYGASMKSCESLKKLDKLSEGCSDNHHYIKAGKTCLKNVEAFISQMTKLPLSDIKKKNFKASKISVENKKSIRRALSKTKKIVLGYNTNIFYPEEFDAPEEMIGNGSEYLKSQVCYSQANQTLKEIRGIMGSYLAKIKAPKTKALMPKNR